MTGAAYWWFRDPRVAAPASMVCQPRQSVAEMAPRKGEGGAARATTMSSPSMTRCRCCLTEHTPHECTITSRNVSSAANLIAGPPLLSCLRERGGRGCFNAAVGKPGPRQSRTTRLAGSRHLHHIYDAYRARQPYAAQRDLIRHRPVGTWPCAALSQLEAWAPAPRRQPRPRSKPTPRRAQAVQ